MKVRYPRPARSGNKEPLRIEGDGFTLQVYYAGDQVDLRLAVDGVAGWRLSQTNRRAPNSAEPMQITIYKPRR